MSLVMTVAEELAALTGAKLTMPTRTLLQGARYVPSHRQGRDRDDEREGDWRQQEENEQQQQEPGT